MKTVAFCYGWSEGPWQSRLFAKNLKEKGFTLSKKLASADVIVAHSAGCYSIPKSFKARVILLIGLPYWPYRNMGLSIVSNIAVAARIHHKEGEIKWWLKKLAHNAWYIFIKPSGTYNALTKLKLENLPKSSSGLNVFLVRNNHETFCHPRIMELVGLERGYKFKQLPGTHEHCWIHPELYVDLILKEL